MDRQKKQLIGILLFLAVCAGVYFGLKAYNASVTEKEEKQAEAKKITAVSIASEELTAFSYELEGKEIFFEKQEDTWYYKDDHSIKIDQDMITSMLSAVEKVTAADRLEDADSSEYGFDEPLNKLVFQNKDETKTVIIGMKNEITSQYYLMASGSDDIYLTDTDLNSTFSKAVEELTKTEEAEETEDTKETEE